MFRILPIFMCLFLVGCNLISGEESYFRNRAKDYRGAYLIEPLDVPSHVEMPAKSDLYPVPSDVPMEHTHVNLEPPEFGQGEVL